MDIKKARELIGEENIKYTDDQILHFIETARFFAEIAIAKIKNGEFKKWKENSKNN